MSRKSVPAAAIAASATLLLAGCLANSSASSSSNVATMPAAAVKASPMNVVGSYIEDLSSYGSKTVVVPTAYVKLLVQGRDFVAKQGGGGNANSVKASVKYQVVGLDKTLAQSIARQAYDDFVAKLRAAGYTVLTYDDIMARDFVAGATREKADAAWGIPTENPQGSSDVYLVAAPSDAQQFKIGLTGVFSEFMSHGKPRFEDAAVIIPSFTIVAPQVWGETGSGYNRISAQIHTAPGMNLSYAAAPWMGKPRARPGGSKAPGVYLKAAFTNLTPRAGELLKAADTTPTAANAISRGLSLLSGAGSVNAQSADYTFTIDRDAYTAAALKGISAFNTEVAKYAATGK